MLMRIAALAQKFRQSRDGAVAIQMGLMAVTMIGFVSLSAEGGFLVFRHRQMQSAADGAAIGGAFALSKNQNVAFEAKALAGKAGFVTGSTSGSLGASPVTVTVNCNNATAQAAGFCAGNVASGPNTGVANAVEVIVGQPQTLFLGSLFPSGSGLFNLRAHAVASNPSVPVCMLALDKIGTAFRLNGTVTVGSPGCGIADNSADNPSTDFKGASGTVQGQFTSQGPQNTNGNNVSFPNATPETGVTVTDPYIANGENAWVLAQAAQAKNVPTSSCKSPTCTAGTCKATSYCTVSGGSLPGGGGPYYINSVSGGTLSNGIYYVDSITNAVTITNATVVVFSGANFGNAAFSITAPKSTSATGEAGLGLVSPNPITVQFGGNGSLQGAIYLPAQNSQVLMKGNVNATCGQIIAGIIDLRGVDKVANDGSCGLTPIPTPGSIALVE
jgi:Flp pilus assembly protein TadG